MTTITLEGGTIADGTGSRARAGNVVIRDDRIVSVGGSETEGRVIDVAGLHLAPGFVDIHSHVDWIAPLPDGNSLLAPNVLQGITTSAAGNCGISPAPLGERFRRGALERMLLVGSVTNSIGWNWRTVAEYFDELEVKGLPFNLCLYVGHSTLRATVLGELTRPATPGELGEMRRLLKEGLDDGAVGLSIGLEYFPGRYAGPTELSELGSVAAAADGLVAIHTRGISALYDPAIEEALQIAREAECRVQLAHVNPMGKANWGAIDGLFNRVDAARAEGLDVGFDMIGYTAWTLTAFEALPHPVADLGLDGVLALANDIAGKETLRNLIENAQPSWPPWLEGRVTRNIPLEMGWGALVVADPVPGLTSERGRTLAALAAERNADPYDVYFDLLSRTRGSARIVNVGYGGDFEDDEPLRRLVTRADAIPETDTVPVGAEGHIHLPLPLFHGTMARFLGHFSRDLGLMSLEQAVHRITQLPAARLRLEARGLLAAGAFADVVAFDADAIADAGTFLDPEPPTGIEHVFVNGAHVVDSGVYDADARAGRALRLRRHRDGGTS